MHFALLLRILHTPPTPYSLVWSYNIHILCGVEIMKFLLCNLLRSIYFSQPALLENRRRLCLSVTDIIFTPTQNEKKTVVLYSNLCAFKCQMGRQRLRIEMQAFSEFNRYLIFFGNIILIYYFRHVFRTLWYFQGIHHRSLLCDLSSILANFISFCNPLDFLRLLLKRNIN
jgi:hypothetical protein